MAIQKQRTAPFFIFLFFWVMIKRGGFSMKVEVLSISEEIILCGGVSDIHTDDDDCLLFGNSFSAVSFEHRNSFSVFTIKEEG